MCEGGLYHAGAVLGTANNIRFCARQSWRAARGTRIEFNAKCPAAGRMLPNDARCSLFVLRLFQRHYLELCACSPN
jgi:hypothetical protein